MKPLGIPLVVAAVCLCVGYPVAALADPPDAKPPAEQTAEVEPAGEAEKA